MPRKRSGQVYVEWHGTHWDSRFELEDGKLTRRKCHPAPARLRGETDDQAILRAKEEAKAEARTTKRLAWRQGWTLQREPDAAPAPGGETIDVYGERWASTRRDQLDVRKHLRFHILPVFGFDTALAAITRPDVERFVRHLDDAVAARKMAWKSAQNIWGSTTKLFSDACNAKKTELRALADRPNPCDGVRGPDRGEDRQSAWLFPREAEQLLSSLAVPEWWRVCYALALYSGLRQGELTVLCVADVVLDAGYISVHRARDRVTGGEKSTKGRRARRVPIEITLRPLLEVLTDGREGTDRLVRMPKKRAMADVLRAHLRAAGVKREELYADDDHRRPLTFHDLRHTFATWLALRGETELVIQSRLGHADTSMTQHYIEAAEAVGHGDVGAPFPSLPSGFGKANRESQPTGAKSSESGAGEGIRTLENPAKTAASVTETDVFQPDKSAPTTDAGASVAPGDVSLERALERAAAAGRWDVVSQLARELEARRLASSPNVVVLPSRRRGGGR